MSEQEIGSDHRGEDESVLGYRIDDCTLIYKDGRYLLIKSDGSERKIGQTPGKLLWTLAAEGLARPDQWVPKEVLLEFVLSKEALKTTICRIKKELVPGKILTKRNEGYRIHAQRIEAVYESASVETAGEPPMESVLPDRPVEGKADDPSPINLAVDAPPSPLEAVEPRPVEMPEALLQGISGKGYYKVMQGLAAVVVLALTVVIVYRANTPTTPRVSRPPVTVIQGGPDPLPAPEVVEKATPKSLPAFNPYVYAVGPPARHPVPLRVRMPAEYDALLLTVFVEEASPTFVMELSERDRAPLLRRTLRKDNHQTVSVVIPADQLKNTTYQLTLHPAGKKSQARNYTLQVQMD